MKKIYFIQFLSFLLLFSGCRKHKVEGPQQSLGRTEEGKLIQQGFVQGVLQARLSSGETIKESFRYEYFPGYDFSTYFDGGEEGEQAVGVNFFRQAINDPKNFFEFTADNVEALDSLSVSGGNVGIDFRFCKDLGQGKSFLFGNSSFSENLPITEISGYSFDPASGRLKFHFKIHYAADNTVSGYDGEVTGDADVIVKKQSTVKGYFVED